MWLLRFCFCSISDREYVSKSVQSCILTCNSKFLKWRSKHALKTFTLTGRLLPQSPEEERVVEPRMAAIHLSGPNQGLQIVGVAGLFEASLYLQTGMSKSCAIRTLHQIIDAPGLAIEFNDQ